MGAKDDAAAAAAVERLSRFVNPLVLNLQKMELELKCPSCLLLLDQPILLPCDHMLCSYCITSLASRESECPSCKFSFLQKDSRPAVHLETLLNIYKNLKSTIGANFQCERTEVNIVERKMPSSGSPASGSNYVKDKSEEDLIHSISNESSPILQLYTSLFGNIGSRQSGDGEENGYATQRNKRCMNYIAEEAFVDQVEQHSPPSFGQIKDSDHDSDNKASEHRTKRPPISDSCKRDLKEVKEFNTGESKRQKLNSECEVDGKCGMEEYNSTICTKIKQERNSNHVDSSITTECVFCHSFRINEATGKMLYYLNGNPIEANQATQPNVLHVHQKCIEWAPQVYYSGDTVMNLEPEIARASKIKCSSCGLKGAALGCYVRSCRRSYHVPCAYEILDCRWDCENYLMLCPGHSSSHRLPCDRTKTRSKNKTNHSSPKSSPSGVLSSTTTRQCPKVWTASPSLCRNWVLCGSALSKEEKELLYKLGSLSGAVVTDSWKDDVTHVIASTDEHGGCSRTLKFLMAILGGKWVLNMKWVKDCMEAGDALPEESYEVTHDVHGLFDGPKRGRIRHFDKAPKLFTGLGFYFSGYFVASYKGYLVDLVVAAGGTLLKKKKDSEWASEDLSVNVYVVYSADPPHEDAAEADGVLRRRCGEAEASAAGFGGRAVPHTWVLDAIAASNLELGI